MSHVSTRTARDTWLRAQRRSCRRGHAGQEPTRGTPGRVTAPCVGGGMPDTSRHVGHVGGGQGNTPHPPTRPALGASTLARSTRRATSRLARSSRTTTRRATTISTSAEGGGTPRCDPRARSNKLRAGLERALLPRAEMSPEPSWLAASCVGRLVAAAVLLACAGSRHLELHEQKA